MNLASVNYHFGSKEALIGEVLTRIIEPINAERLRLLDRAEAEHGSEPVPIELILDALYRPVVTELKKPGHQASLCRKLAGRCLSIQAEEFTETLVRLFDEVVKRFIPAVGRSLPHLDETEVFWRVHFSVGTLVYALTHEDRLEMFSRGRVRATAPEDTLGRLVEFTAAGLRAESTVADGETRQTSRRSGAVVGAVAGLLLLTGCQSLSPADAAHHASVSTPEHWIAGPSHQPAHHPDRHWIENFDEENLTGFVDSVIDHNKDLEVAQARIEIARSNARIAGSDLYPQIQGTFSGQRNLQNFIGFPFGGAPADTVFSTRSNRFGLSLDLSWEIDLWGRIRAATAAAVAEFEASKFDRSSAELSLAGQAAKAWFALAETRDQVALTRSTIGTFSETEGLLRERFEAGIDQGGRSFASELLLAEADVANARETLASQRELVGRTSRQLEVLAGRYPAGRAGDSARLPGFPDPVPAGLPATLLDRRPDLAASERRIAAADERLLEAKRALLPSIGLTGNYGTASSDVSDLLDGTFSVWSLAGNVAPAPPPGRPAPGQRIPPRIGAAPGRRRVRAGRPDRLFGSGKRPRRRTILRQPHRRPRRGGGSGTRGLPPLARRIRERHRRHPHRVECATAGLHQPLELLTLRRRRLENRVDLHLALGGSFDPGDSTPGDSTPNNDDPET